VHEACPAKEATQASAKGSFGEIWILRSVSGVWARIKGKFVYPGTSSANRALASALLNTKGQKGFSQIYFSERVRGGMRSVG
jgi:hypothetical protein